MRCQFCGWDNPDGKTSCEKCNKPLVSSQSNYANGLQLNNTEDDNHSRPTNRQSATAGADFNPKKTIRENLANMTMAEEEHDNANTCPQCGYEMENGVCPMCGHTVNTPAADPRKTMRPIRKGDKEGTFTLTPISEETGMPEGEAMKYDGNDVCLNRDNTDPRNKTITSQEQAAISFADGKWSIIDKSQLKTTFVQAENAIELQDNSIILLGSQLYRFNI